MDKSPLYADMSSKAGFAYPPMQGELQDMLGDYDKCLDRLEEYFGMGINRGLEYYFQFTSFEQLWLAFVMKDKYNKVWRDGEWEDYG